MSLSKAIKFCPGLTVLPPDPGLTEKANKALGNVVARYSPLWEPFRPGHIYLDITGTERLWGKAKDTAYYLRNEIKDRLCLSGTVGVAGNKMVSSIASKIILNEGVLDVDHGREASFMAPLKVDVLPGIGRFRQKILLQELSITRVRELAALDMGSLSLVFGREAYLIHQRAIGIDLTPVYPLPAKPMINEEITFPEDENDDQRLLSALYSMVEKCILLLRRRTLIPRKAGLLIRYSDQVEISRQITLPRASFLDLDLYFPLERLFLRACNRRVRVRFMKVCFWNFFPESRQLSLFHIPSHHAEKQSLVIQVLDLIRERHGEDAIRFGRAA
jgi:DNA polymerase-4